MKVFSDLFYVVYIIFKELCIRNSYKWPTTKTTTTTDNNVNNISNNMSLTETYNTVRVGENVSDMFPIRNGLNQGDALRHCFSTLL